MISCNQAQAGRGTQGWDPRGWGSPGGGRAGREGSRRGREDTDRLGSLWAYNSISEMLESAECKLRCRHWWHLMKFGATMRRSKTKRTSESLVGGMRTDLGYSKSSWTRRKQRHQDLSRTAFACLRWLLDVVGGFTTISCVFAWLCEFGNRSWIMLVSVCWVIDSCRTMVGEHQTWYSQRIHCGGMAWAAERFVKGLVIGVLYSADSSMHDRFASNFEQMVAGDISTFFPAQWWLRRGDLTRCLLVTCSVVA